MADNKKISELTAASAPTGAELVEIVQGGVNKKLTLEELVSVIAFVIQDVVSTVGVTITLDLNDNVIGVFSAAEAINEGKEIIRTDTDNAAQWIFIFEVGTPDIALDFGDDTRSTHALFVDGVYTPQDVGLHKVVATRYGPDGDLWLLDFRSVYSVGDTPPTPADQVYYDDDTFVYYEDDTNVRYEIS